MKKGNQDCAVPRWAKSTYLGVSRVLRSTREHEFYTCQHGVSVAQTAIKALNDCVQTCCLSSLVPEA